MLGFSCFPAFVLFCSIRSWWSLWLSDSKTQPNHTHTTTPTHRFNPISNVQLMFIRVLIQTHSVRIRCENYSTYPMIRNCLSNPSDLFARFWILNIVCGQCGEEAWVTAKCMDNNSTFRLVRQRPHRPQLNVCFLNLVLQNWQWIGRIIYRHYIVRANYNTSSSKFKGFFNIIHKEEKSTYIYYTRYFCEVTHCKQTT